MKKKAFNELKTKDIDSLRKSVNSLEKEIINELLELKMGKVRNVHTTTNKKKDIAQIKTLIRMKLLVEKKTPKRSDEKVITEENKNSKEGVKAHAAS